MAEFVYNYFVIIQFELYDIKLMVEIVDYV
jgi:hypothetical protein